MKKRYAFVATASLILGTAPGWCQDRVSTPLMAAPASSAEVVDAPPSTFGARLLTLKQRVGDWARVRLVNQEVTTPVAPTAPAQDVQVVSPPPPPPVAPPLYAVGAPCLSASRHRSCGEALDDWLTYRRLDHDCCFCFPKCTPCCNPPLYTYFIGNCCVQPIPGGYGPACACSGCSSGGHRLTGLWAGIHGCRFWPGNGNFDFRQWWDDFLFKHDESVTADPQ